MDWLEKRNDAVRVNGNTKNGKHVDITITTRGSDFYFAICAVMGFVALSIIVASATKPRADRTFSTSLLLLILLLVLVTLPWAQILDGRLLMVNGRGLMLRWLVAIRGNYWHGARFFTTPLLLMDLLLTAGLPWPTILWTIFLDEVMIVTGLVGALVRTRYKWGFWAFGTVAMFGIFWNLAIGGRRQAKHLGNDIYRTNTLCGCLALLIRLSYPICWGVSEGANVIPPDSEAVFCGVLDFLAKPVFSIVLPAGHWNINPGRMGLKLRDYNEEPSYFGPKNGTEAEAAKENARPDNAIDGPV
ncbi:bacteriorhodopsin [Aureobasidium subglaciale]|nr:bacteriorhodopsin [Aureobasidium subglaciale]KAI5223753.1 bacteriorhodopsin [Aureobasidium subglaciale]KAI5227116.1 bacteriorhodopsin [Aureobasidium subglaciale]KAI5262542.1 bacteriorhodopsin [Aureobasidium subglaciale]